MGVENRVTLEYKVSADSCVIVEFLVIATIVVKFNLVLFDVSIDDIISVVVQLFVINIVPNAVLVFKAGTFQFG